MVAYTIHDGTIWRDPLGNTRAPEQFKIIKNAIDVRTRRVVDLGSGHADLANALRQAGALMMCIDMDNALVREARTMGLPAMYMDVEEFPDTVAEAGMDVDIVICFSVLPYLKDPIKFLTTLPGDVLLLEFQYAGDGPGFKDVPDDDVAKHWLAECGWQAEPIGKTFVPGRDMWRTIWLCTR